MLALFIFTILTDEKDKIPVFVQLLSMLNKDDV